MCFKGLDFKGFLYKRIQDHVLKDPGQCLNPHLCFKGLGIVFKRIWDSCLTRDLCFKESGLVSPWSRGIPSGIRDDLCPLRAAESSIHLPPPQRLRSHLSTGNRQFQILRINALEIQPRGICAPRGEELNCANFVSGGWKNPDLGIINEEKKPRRSLREGKSSSWDEEGFNNSQGFCGN